jgi:hypothetical protein
MTKHDPTQPDPPRRPEPPQEGVLAREKRRWAEMTPEEDAAERKEMARGIERFKP